MNDKIFATWTRVLLFIGGLTVLGPLCYLVWLGTVSLAAGGFSKDAWLQSVANIFGSALSGGVAAAVAIWILHREQRERDKVESAAWQNTINAIEGWIDSLTETVEREAVAIARHFSSNDQRIAVATTNALKAVCFPEMLQFRIANRHPDLFNETRKIDAVIDRFVQPLERSVRLGPVPGMISAGYAPVSPLEPDDIRVIGILPDELGHLLLKVCRAEPALATKCNFSAQRLFRTTDATIQMAREAHGIVFNRVHQESRPDWYTPA